MSGPGRGSAERLYAWGAALHAALYDRRILKPFVAPVPVISVGNLSAGGTGKTPCVIWLARALGGRGLHPAVLTRGYGRRDARNMTVLAPGEARPALTATGDEPLEIAEACPDLPVIIGRARTAGALLAVRRFHADCLVLDDGFQHRPLHRDFDLVLLDAARPFGNGRLLPAGPLREPPAALSRASAILLTRAARAADLEGARIAVSRQAPGVPVGAADHLPVGLAPVEPGSTGRRPPAGSRVIIAAGTADPGSVADSARTLGYEVAELLAWPDHHRFRPADLARVEGERGGLPVVTTGKDLPRWRAVSGFDAVREWWVLRVEFRPADEEGLLSAIRRAVDDGAQMRSAGRRDLGNGGQFPDHWKSADLVRARRPLRRSPV